MKEIKLKTGKIIYWAIVYNKYRFRDIFVKTMFT